MVQTYKKQTAPSALPNLLPTSGNKIGEIWPNFYVVWTLFPGFWGLEVYFWGQKAPLVRLCQKF